MPRPDKPDTRNLQWRSGNVGSKLLQKMGWKEGQGVGKRQRNEETSSEGLRVHLRPDELGIGAQRQSIYNTEDHGHVQNFAAVLSKLNQEHNQISKSNSKKRKTTAHATNRQTHAKVRKAKFEEKTEEDMKCIFAGTVVDFPKLVSSKDEKKEKRKKDRKEKKEKKRRKDR